MARENPYQFVNIGGQQIPVRWGGGGMTELGGAMLGLNPATGQWEQISARAPGTMALLGDNAGQLERQGYHSGLATGQSSYVLDTGSPQDLSGYEFAFGAPQSQYTYHPEVRESLLGDSTPAYWTDAQGNRVNPGAGFDPFDGWGAVRGDVMGDVANMTGSGMGVMEGFTRNVAPWVVPAVGNILGAAGAMAGGASAGGTGLGGGIGSGSLGSGLSASAGGVTGITPGAMGAAGISGAAPLNTALAPGFFAAESLPTFGGLGAGIGAGVSSSGVGGGALGSGITPGVPSTGIGGGALGTGVGVPAAGSASGGASVAGGAAAAGGLGGLAEMGAGVLDKVLGSPQLLGLAGGALLGGMGGSEQAGTITVEEGLPDWLLPYVKPQLDKYSSLVQNYNVDPYGVMPAAMSEFQKTLAGDYLDPSTNKYLQDYFNLGAERVKGALAPSFGHMQAFGSHSGYNEALSRGLSDMAVGLYGGNYAKERDRMTATMGAAPGFLQGATQATFSPYTTYLDTVAGLGKKRTDPYFENQFSNILGGAMTGYGLGSMFK